MSKKMNDERKELARMILAMTPDELSELIDRAKHDPFHILPAWILMRSTNPKRCLS